MFKFAKHLHVLNLLTEIPAPEMVTNGYMRCPCTQEEATACWDHLFDYIHANWVEPDSTMEVGGICEFRFSAQGLKDVADCNKMLRMPKEEFVARLESLPPYFSEVIFPVAVGRFLLREIGLPLDHRKTTTFREFHRRYANIILADC